MSPYFEVGEFIKPSGLTGLVDLYLCYWTYTRDMRSAMLLKSFHSSNPSNYVLAFTTLRSSLWNSSWNSCWTPPTPTTCRRSMRQPAPPTPKMSSSSAIKGQWPRPTRASRRRMLSKGFSCTIIGGLMAISLLARSWRNLSKRRNPPPRFAG